MVGGVDAKELRAPVFNIVHGSFVDGWGTRTTIFLKGCPLNCVWCCNPEGQKTYPELRFTQQDCNGCGKCVTVCPKQAIHRNIWQLWTGVSAMTVLPARKYVRHRQWMYLENIILSKRFLTVSRGTNGILGVTED